MKKFLSAFLAFLLPCTPVLASINASASYPCGSTPVLSTTIFAGFAPSITGTVKYSSLVFCPFNFNSDSSGPYAMTSGGTVFYRHQNDGSGSTTANFNSSFTGHLSSLSMDDTGTPSYDQLSATINGAVDAISFNMNVGSSAGQSVTTNQSSALSISSLTANGSPGPQLSIYASNVTSLSSSSSMVAYYCTLNFSGAFDQTSVDGLLAGFDGGGGAGATLTISGSSSTPSSTGLTSEDSLVAKGWTVTTN